MARRFIRRVIQDLGSADRDVFLDAEQCIQTQVFDIARRRAGYPEELLDTLDSLVSVSEASRKFFSQELLKHLKAEWEAGQQ